MWSRQLSGVGEYTKLEFSKPTTRKRKGAEGYELEVDESGDGVEGVEGCEMDESTDQNKENQSPAINKSHRNQSATPNNPIQPPPIVQSIAPITGAQLYSKTSIDTAGTRKTAIIC